MSVEMELKTKNTELETMKNQIKGLRAKIEQDGANASAEDRTTLNNTIDAGMKLREVITRLENERDLLEPVQVDAQKAIDMARNGGHDRKSPGQRVISSEQFKNNNRQDLGRVNVGAMPRAGKALYSAADAAGGVIVQPQREAEIVNLVPQRPPSIVDLINQSETTVDAVQYIEMTGRTNNAAVVSERTAADGTAGDVVFGLKPESTMTFAEKTAVVETIATYVLASRQILQDAPRLRDVIDNELTYMVEVALENRVITRMLAWTGIQTRVHAVSGRDFDAGDTIADTIRRAITDVTLEFYRPSGIVLNPIQGEALELEKDANNAYLRVYDTTANRIWRVPVLETAAMTDGTALVADFRLAATLWDRMATEILTGQPNDLFLRNAWAILAELRAAFAVTRPKAVEKITGM